MLLFAAVAEDEEDYERPSSGGLLIFLLVFLLCLAVFAGIGFLWWQRQSTPATDETATTTAATTMATSRFGNYAHQSVFVYITDDSGTLQSVVLLAANGDSGTVEAFGFPAALSLSEAETDTLQARLSSSGIDAAQSALNSALGLSVTHYFLLPYSAASAALTAFGGDLLFDLPESVNVRTASGDAAALSAGERALSAKQLTEVLQYEGWQGGRRARAHMHALLIAAFVDQFLVSGRDGTADFEVLSTVGGSTDLTTSAIQAQSAFFSVLAAANQGNLVTVSETVGDFAGAGDTLRFTPSDTMLQAVQAAV